MKWLSFYDTIVMNLSWNFPSWAKPSYKGSERSQAELGHLNFWAENLSIFFLCIAFIAQSFFCLASTNFWTKKKKYYSIKEKTESRVPSLLKMLGNKKKCNFFVFQTEIKFSCWRKKAPSRAKNPSARAMAQASLARTHHKYKLWGPE